MTSEGSRRAAYERMSQHLTLGSVIGATLGAAIGVATGDLGFWAAIGIPLGVACGFATSRRANYLRRSGSNPTTQLSQRTRGRITT